MLIVIIGTSKNATISMRVLYLADSQQDCRQYELLSIHGSSKAPFRSVVDARLTVIHGNSPSVQKEQQFHQLGVWLCREEPFEIE